MAPSHGQFIINYGVAPISEECGQTVITKEIAELPIIS